MRITNEYCFHFSDLGGLGKATMLSRQHQHSGFIGLHQALGFTFHAEKIGVNDWAIPLLGQTGLIASVSAKRGCLAFFWARERTGQLRQCGLSIFSSHASDPEKVARIALDAVKGNRQRNDLISLFGEGGLIEMDWKFSSMIIEEGLEDAGGAVAIEDRLPKHIENVNAATTPIMLFLGGVRLACESSVKGARALERLSEEQAEDMTDKAE